MRKLAKISSMVVLTALFLFTGCAKSDSDESNSKNSEVESVVTKISAKDAKEKIDSGEDLIILDVRELDEYNEGHIKDSMLLPLGNINGEADKKLTDKEETILVYCRSGRRSAEAAKILNNLGYTKVYDFGGIIDWPYDIVK